ncbi:hypothetical protein [Amycolatopsis sp. NPDC051102]|uniref:hypothetical protein n=1 Tax=Amycolatopsis sp. NPDC051102 TaxID=3155163 RepID=UPI003427C7A5
MLERRIAWDARMFKSVAETDPDHMLEALANHAIQLLCVERLTKRLEWKEGYKTDPDGAKADEAGEGEVR